MTTREYAVREWLCQACGDQCQSMSRENDGYDLLCQGCGRAYVIVAPDYATPAGA